MNKFLFVIIPVVFLFSCTEENKSSTNDGTKNEPTLNADYSSKTIVPSKKENNSIKVNSDLKELFIRSNFWINKLLFENYPDSTEYKAKLLESLSVRDIDKDGVNELIYFGFSGSEPMITCIFELNSDSLIQTFGEYQSIISEAPINDSTTEIRMSNPGCCMETVGYEDRFYYIQGKDSTYVKLLKSTANVDYMTEDGKLIKPINFITIQADYNLRARPTTEELIDENPNVLAKLPNNMRGIAYKEFTDSTGRIWWFVEIPPSQDQKVKLYGDSDDKKVYHTGWISSRYVKSIQ